jgi:uncharacterized membrane protein
VTAALRLALLLAYWPLAHVAGVQQSPLWAALAVGSVVLLVLIDGLLALRPGAWLAAALSAAVLVALARSAYGLIPLMLMPATWVGLLALWFGRSLRAGHTPLITRLVAAIYAQAGEALSPRHLRYTRRLTALWTSLLALLTALNLVLALIAVPGGVLVELGITPAVQVTPEQWSLLANFAVYGVLGGFMLIEYQVRKRVFPVRPYRNFLEFLRMMGRLGPDFWKDFLR